MKIFLMCLMLVGLAACQGPAPASPTGVPAETLTGVPAATFTGVPAATFTGMPQATSLPPGSPTPAGGSEPRVAFAAKDAQGNLGLYIAGFFGGQATLVTPLNLPEEPTFSKMRWSPDGGKLAFTNTAEDGQRWLFVFDEAANSIRPHLAIPEGRYVEAVTWATDGASLVVTTANLNTLERMLAYFRVDLVSGTAQQVQIENPWINNVSMTVNGAVCYESLEAAVRSRLSGYVDVCYFPEIGLYGGMKVSEQASDYVLLTGDGQEQAVLHRFPPGFTTNGAINLLLAPDRSQVLLVGEPNGGLPFAIPVDPAGVDLSSSEPPVFQLDDSALATPAPDQHVLTGYYVYGWSPDSTSYLAARFFAEARNAADFSAQGEFVIIEAETGKVLSTFAPPPGLELAIDYASGYDLVWRAQSTARLPHFQRAKMGEGRTPPPFSEKSAEFRGGANLLPK